MLLKHMQEITIQQQLEKMRADWDQRARDNARYYVNTSTADWTDEEFFASGERTVAEEILTDMINICQGKEPKQMRVLEIGCGVGLLVQHLAPRCAVYRGTDLSASAIGGLRRWLEGKPEFGHVELKRAEALDLEGLALARQGRPLVLGKILMRRVKGREVGISARVFAYSGGENSSRAGQTLPGLVEMPLRFGRHRSMPSRRISRINEVRS